ncbi:MAG: hypothetical protein ABEI06_06560 [Halobacteriaceae archaeon]
MINRYQVTVLALIIGILLTTIAPILGIPFESIIFNNRSTIRKADTDHDGLSNSYERHHNLNPYNHDMDGDALLDGWEVNEKTPTNVPLPNASPVHKDIYLHIFVTNSVPPLTDHEIEELTQIWIEFPISNPNNKSGIDIHIINQTQIDALQYPYEKLQRNYEFFVSDRKECIYYATFVTNIPKDRLVSGFAKSGGLVSIIDGLPGSEYDKKYPIRTIFLTHELLHNIVGVIDIPHMIGDKFHSSRGWLAYSYFTPRHYQLSETVSSDINQYGFALNRSTTHSC